MRDGYSGPDCLLPGQPSRRLVWGEAAQMYIYNCPVSVRLVTLPSRGTGVP
jgi:hypothetical protein